MGANASQFVAGGAPHGDGVEVGREVGEEIEAIDGLGSCNKTIGAIQRDHNTIERRLFVGILCAVAVGVEIDKVANRPQRLEGDGMVGLVVTEDGVADGAGVGGVGDDLGAVGRGGDGDNGGGVG